MSCQVEVSLYILARVVPLGNHTMDVGDSWHLGRVWALFPHAGSRPLYRAGSHYLLQLDLPAPQQNTCFVDVFNKLA